MPRTSYLLKKVVILGASVSVSGEKLIPRRCTNSQDRNGELQNDPIQVDDEVSPTLRFEPAVGKTQLDTQSQDDAEGKRKSSDEAPIPAAH